MCVCVCVCVCMNLCMCSHGLFTCAHGYFCFFVIILLIFQFTILVISSDGMC